MTAAVDEAVPRLDRFLFAPAGERAAAHLRLAVAASVPVFFWSVGANADPDTGLGWWFDAAFGRWWYSVLVVAASAAHGMVHRRGTGAALVVLVAPLLFVATGQQSRQVIFTAVVASALLQPRPGRAGAGPMWVVRLVQLQLTVLYLVNALAKLTPGYLRGDVLAGLSVMRPNFVVDLSSGRVTVAGLEVSVQVLAIASVLAELFLAFALWHPAIRRPAAVFGLGFHLALTQVVDIHLLGWATLFLYLPFLLDWENDAGLRSGGWRGWRCRR